MSTATNTPAKLLHSRADVLALIGVSIASLNRWIASGAFPKPDVMLGAKRAWKVETVRRWVDAGGTAGRGAL